MSIEKQTVELLKSKNLSLPRQRAVPADSFQNALPTYPAPPRYSRAALSVIQTVSKKMCSAFPRKP